MTTEPNEPFITSKHTLLVVYKTTRTLCAYKKPHTLMVAVVVAWWRWVTWDGDDDNETMMMMMMMMMMMRVVALLLWLPDGEGRRRVEESEVGDRVDR
ncbi:hypothetical protein Tco_0124709 [Tanacetum coccineum]